MVSAQSAAAPVLGLILSVLFIWVFTNYKPFKKSSDSNISVILAVSLLFLFLAALMIKVNATSDTDSDQEVFGIILVGVLAAGPAVITIQAAASLLASTMQGRGCGASAAGGTTPKGDEEDPETPVQVSDEIESSAAGSVKASMGSKAPSRNSPWLVEGNDTGSVSNSEEVEMSELSAGRAKEAYSRKRGRAAAPMRKSKLGATNATAASATPVEFV